MKTHFYILICTVSSIGIVHPKPKTLAFKFFVLTISYDLLIKIISPGFLFVCLFCFVFSGTDRSLKWVTFIFQGKFLGNLSWEHMLCKPLEKHLCSCKEDSCTACTWPLGKRRKKKGQTRKQVGRLCPQISAFLLPTIPFEQYIRWIPSFFGFN